VIGLVAISVIGGIGYSGWQYKLELDRKAEIAQQEELAKAEEARRQEEARQEALRQEELAKAEEARRQEEARQEEVRQEQARKEAQRLEEERKKAQANLVLPPQCVNHFNANYNKPGYANNKAYAIAYDGTNSYCTMSYNSPTPQQANQNALQSCEQNKYKNNVRTACYVYRLN